MREGRDARGIVVDCLQQRHGLGSRGQAAAGVAFQPQALALIQKIKPANFSHLLKSVTVFHRGNNNRRTPQPWLLIIGRHSLMVAVGTRVICSASSACLIASCTACQRQLPR